LPKKKIISTQRAPGQEYGPFSQAVRAGDFIFLMGQAALEPGTGEIVGTEIKAQTRKTLENMREILKASGATFDDLIQVRVFLKNADDWAALNEVYREYIKRDFPARTAVVVRFAMKGILVEIDAIAYLGQ
jgi:2-iminobutanoate/2-iminopropanoate deaminase